MRTAQIIVLPPFGTRTFELGNLCYASGAALQATMVGSTSHASMWTAVRSLLTLALRLRNTSARVLKRLKGYTPRVSSAIVGANRLLTSL
jgi:hypothetical protein